MNLPNFFVLGAAKSGTTSVYRYLDQHPDVYFPVNKEPQYFCNEALYERGLQFYSDTFFQNVGDRLAIGEATPHYLFYTKAGERIRKTLPASSHRFIVILRDPVERAYSHYRNMVFEGYETLAFADALRAEAERVADPRWERLGTIRYSYFGASLYGRQLREYLALFSQDRFLILFSDELAENPGAVVARTFRFLGLQPVKINTGAKHNPSARPRSTRLQGLIRGPSRVRHAVGKLLPYNWKVRIVQRLIEFNRLPDEYEPIDPETAANLRSRLVPDIEELEKITGRDLAAWKG